MKMKKLFKKSFLWIVLSIFLFPAVSATAQTRVEIGTLFEEYGANIVRADQRYNGQIIELVGKVQGNIRSGRNPSTQREEFYVILIDREFRYARYGGIRAFFSAENRNQVARLDQEQNVIIRGRLSRTDRAGRQFILTNSSVVYIGATASERADAVRARLAQYQQEREREQARIRAERQAEQERVQQERERERERIEHELNNAPKFVTINGVNWATRNIDTPGTFVSGVEDLGRSFGWHQVQNVCPQGWRLPTRQEAQALISAGSVAIAHNRVRGQLLGTASGQVFLPTGEISRGRDASLHYWVEQQEVLHNRGVGDGRSVTRAYVRCVTDVSTLAELAEITEQARLAEEEHRQERIRQEEERARQLRELNTSLEGVVINGVRWATRNVNTSRTFADAPEDRGGDFRLNDKGRACPRGWRVPTKSELQSLVDAGSVERTRNGVTGRLFGTYPNQIFLPNRPFQQRLYWSSTRSGRNSAYGLFQETGTVEIRVGVGNFTNGIRCVAR